MRVETVRPEACVLQMADLLGFQEKIRAEVAEIFNGSRVVLCLLYRLCG